MKEDIKSKLMSTKTSPIKSRDLLSTGSTLLNMACSGRPFGGIGKGHYLLLVGDSNSGKTWISRTLMAEASINENFDGYRLIFDNAENGSLMDDVHFFGPRMAERVEPPAGSMDSPINSSTVEEFYFNVDNALQDGRPFIYVLDSMDALDSEDDEEHFQKQKAAHGTKKEVAGTYGTAKARMNGKIRLVGNGLKKNGSILVVIAQTRDKIGFGAMFNPKTRSGGKALKFFAHIEIWCSVREKITKKYLEKNRTIGTLCQMKVERSRITGVNGCTVEVPIYHSTGIDDIGGCIDYLIDEGHWKKTKQGVITAQEFEVSLKRDALIRHIEEDELESELRRTVAAVWRSIEEACAISRKSRYT